MISHSFKVSLLAAAVSASLAACGGGGGGDSTTTTTTTTPPAPTGTTTTATAPTGQTLTAQTGSSSGTASDTSGVITVGAPASPNVPAANVVTTSVATPTYGATSQALTLWNSIQDWRSQARYEEEGAFGVGLLTQRANLDTLAASLVTAQPNLTSSDATLRAAAVSAAQSQMTALGYTVSYVAATSSVSALTIPTGQYCSKALFSSLPGAEIGISGMRFAGISVPETQGAMCVMLAGLESIGTWQLPPTGSSSVYPFPGKQLTLPRYYGDWAALGFTSQPGHAVHVSVASVDALPAAIPGAGTGAAIATSAITVSEFTLRLKSSGATVPTRIFSRPGMNAGAGVTLEATTQLLFPTSIVAIPVQPLETVSVYTATFRGTVNGRSVTRTWDFTTSN
jgi:hypothetical protein